MNILKLISTFRVLTVLFGVSFFVLTITGCGGSGQVGSGSIANYRVDSQATSDVISKLISGLQQSSAKKALSCYASDYSAGSGKGELNYYGLQDGYGDLSRYLYQVEVNGLTVNNVSYSAYSTDVMSAKVEFRLTLSSEKKPLGSHRLASTFTLTRQTTDGSWLISHQEPGAYPTEQPNSKDWGFVCWLLQSAIIG